MTSTRPILPALSPPADPAGTQAAADPLAAQVRLRLRGSRVRAVLLVCVGLIVTLVLAQTWWTVAQDRRLTLASAHATGLIAVRLLDEHATQTLRDAERNLDAVATAVADAVAQSGARHQLDDHAIRDVITGGKRDSRYLNALQFVNLQGLPFVKSTDYPAFQFDIVDRTYVPGLLAHPEQRAAVLGHPFQRFYDKELVLPLARNLYDADGRHLGIVSIDINVSYFAGVYARVAKDSGALVSLFSDRGFVIVRSPFDPAYLNLDISKSPAMAQLRAAGAEGVFDDARFLDIGDSVARQYSYRKLGAYGVTTVFAQRQDAVLADWAARTRDRAWFAAIAIGFIGVLTAFLLHHMNRLQRSEQAIRELNTSLELRVSQRTLKLEQANDELEQALHVLQATQHELLRTEKLAALGSLVAGVAHELNTPIGNSIMMASSLQANAQTCLDELHAERPSRSRMEQALASGINGTEILVRNLVRAGELVHSFKQVAVDQSSDHRRKFRLSRTIEEVLATLEPMYKKTPFRMELALDPEVAMDGYPGALAQIITNLVSNALAHAFDGRDEGVMRITTRQQGTPDAPEVLLEFSDDGNGIEPAQLERVFDPFFTTKLGQGGSGLGMHIVYNLVTALLGGSITLHSAPGAGFRLSMVLPLVAPTAPLAPLNIAQGPAVPVG